MAERIPIVGIPQNALHPKFEGKRNDDGDDDDDDCGQASNLH